MMKLLLIILVFLAGMRADAILLERALSPTEAAEIATLKRDELAAILTDLADKLSGKVSASKLRMEQFLIEEGAGAYENF